MFFFFTFLREGVLERGDLEFKKNKFSFFKWFEAVWRHVHASPQFNKEIL